MAVVANPGNLQTAQGGNADSTNTIQRTSSEDPNRPALLRIVSAIGATPTVTVNIMGSVDGTTFYNVPYAVAGALGAFVVAPLVITTAVTGLYLLMPGQPWKFLKLVMTLNTNVTLTSDLL